jgi:hypothetical protein
LNKRISKFQILWKDYIKKKNEIALLLENNKKIQGLKVTANDMIEEIN